MLAGRRALQRTEMIRNAVKEFAERVQLCDWECIISEVYLSSHFYKYCKWRTIREPIRSVEDAGNRFPAPSQDWRTLKSKKDRSRHSFRNCA